MWSLHSVIYKKHYYEALEVSNRLFYAYPDVSGKETPAIVLSLVGLKAHYFHLCSMGFTYLEHSELLSSKKRQRLKVIALRIFATVDAEEGVKSKCSKCNRKIVSPQVRCECGFVTALCLVSGASVNKKSFWRCERCNHVVLRKQMDRFSICSLCHSRTLENCFVCKLIRSLQIYSHSVSALSLSVFIMFFKRKK